MGRVLVFIIGLVLVTPTVNAQTVCLDHDNMVKKLYDEYKEKIRVTALMNDNTVIELFSNDSYDSWTLVRRGSNNITCIIATGKAVFVEFPPQEDLSWWL